MVLFVIRIVFVFVVLIRWDLVEFIWLRGGDENEVIFIEDEEEGEDNDDRSGSDDCDD